MSAHRTQDRQGLLLHFQQRLQFQQRGAVFALAQQVRHLEHHSVQHRFHHGVDIRTNDGIRAGIGTDLGNFSRQRRHGTAGDVNQIRTQIIADLLACRQEVTAHPRDQLPLTLFGKLNDGAVFIDGAPQLLQPLIGLPGYGLVGKDHGAVVRDVREYFRSLVPLCLRQPEQVDLIHLNQGMRCHHGQIFHGIGKVLDGKGLIIQLVEIKGFRQLVQEDLLHLLEIVIQQKDFLTMENIEPAQFFGLDGLLEDL